MGKTLFNLFEYAIDFTNKLVYLLISLALVAFLWGIVKILFNSSDPKAKTEGRQYMLYGRLTLFVMTSVWSIVYILKDTITPSTSTGTNLKFSSDRASNPVQYDQGFQSSSDRNSNPVQYDKGSNDLDLY